MTHKDTTQKTKTYSSVIFDYGGTLDTDARHWASVLWDGFRAASVDITKAAFCDAYVFAERALAASPIVQPTDTFLRLLQKKVDVETQRLVATAAWAPSSPSQRRDVVDQVAAWCNAYALRHISSVRPLLEALSEKCPLVLVSNFYGNVEAVLNDYQLTPYFSKIVESAVVGVRKPDPAIYRLGVEATGCEAQRVVVVGDSYSKDMVPAKTVGCQTVWLRGESWTDFTADLTTDLHAPTPALKCDRSTPQPATPAAPEAHPAADHVLTTIQALHPLLLPTSTN